MEDIFNKRNNFKDFENVKSVLKYGDANNIPNPVVSILMPVYKRPDTFKESLKYALNQDFAQPYEIVVVDNYDGEDESPNLEIVRQSGAKNIMYYHNESNLGMYGNWNRGIELARADFITYCHDDDLLLPNCLKRLMELQKVTNNKCILSQFNRIDENGAYISTYDYPHIKRWFFKEKDHYEYTLYNQFISSMGFGVGCLFNRLCVLELGGYNKEYYPSADYAFQASYTYYYGCVINNVPTFNYRVAQNESLKVYKYFARTNTILRHYIAQKIKLPNFWLHRVRKAIYRMSYIAFEINWGGGDPSILKSISLSDKLIMKIANFSNRIKGYTIFG